MRKLLLMVTIAGLSLLLVIASGMIGCGEETVSKELVAPQMEIRDFSREATVVPADPNDLAAMTIVVDMALQVSNPNDFEISADSLLMKVYADDVLLEHPAYDESIYVPGGETVTFHKSFVFQPMTVIGIIMGEGKSFGEALTIAMAVWAEVTGDTATWDLECVTSISSEWGDLNKTYQLSWTTPS